MSEGSCIWQQKWFFANFDFWNSTHQNLAIFERNIILWSKFGNFARFRQKMQNSCTRESKKFGNRSSQSSSSPEMELTDTSSCMHPKGCMDEEVSSHSIFLGVGIGWRGFLIFSIAFFFLGEKRNHLSHRESATLSRREAATAPLKKATSGLRGSPGVWSMGGQCSSSTTPRFFTCSQSAPIELGSTVKCVSGV